MKVATVLALIFTYTTLSSCLIQKTDEPNVRSEKSRGNITASTEDCGGHSQAPRSFSGDLLERQPSSGYTPPTPAAHYN